MLGTEARAVCRRHRSWEAVTSVVRKQWVAYSTAIYPAAMDTWDAGSWGQHPPADHMLTASFIAPQVELGVVAALAESTEAVKRRKQRQAAWLNDGEPRWIITVPASWGEVQRLAVRNGHSRALSKLLTADRIIASLKALSEELSEDAVRSRRFAGRLRATAEQDTGLPCIAFSAEADLDSSTRNRWAWARHTTDVLEYVTEGGSTDYVPRFSQEPSWADAALCREETAAAIRQAQGVRGCFLIVLVREIGLKYGFARSVPPNEASPCGVLRLAAPIVPGAPGVWSWPHSTTLTPTA